MLNKREKLNTDSKDVNSVNTEALERAIKSSEEVLKWLKDTATDDKDYSRIVGYHECLCDFRLAINTFLTEYKKQVHLTVDELEGMKKSYSMRSEFQESREGYNQAINDIIATKTEQQKDQQND